jgi:hypothetical protein
MIDEILNDTGMGFSPVFPDEDWRDKYIRLQELFQEIENHLHNNGVKTGYVLGRFAEHESIALFKYHGYWFISGAERRERWIEAIFVDVHDAVNVFLCKRVSKANETLSGRLIREVRE